MQMGNQNYTTTILVDKSKSEVFNAIVQVDRWWQGEIKGSSKKLNEEFEYRMPGIHFSKQRVVEIVPDKKVVWLVVESNLGSFKDKEEWNGTRIIFEITELKGKTQLQFTHEGLNPQFQCYGDCSGAWELLVQKSLFSLITTGKGRKVF
jgi:hypothetical protein